MDDRKSSAELPDKPEWVIMTAAKTAAIYAAGFAIISALGSKIPGLNKILWTHGAKDEAISGAIVGGAIGGVFGAMQGSNDHAKYPLEVANAHLKNHIRQLTPNKSFVQQVEQEQSTTPLQFPPHR